MIETIRIRRLELAFAPRPWPFADERRADIARYFGELQRAKPALWNGRMLLLHHHAVEGDVFRGGYLETDFASFVAWRDWGFPDATMKHCVALGALRASDGGFLLGVMNSHTLNAGKVYFPAGVPDPSDIVDGMVDLDGSVRREMARKPGSRGMLTPPSPSGIASSPRRPSRISSCCRRASPRWCCVSGSGRISQARPNPNSPTSALCAVPKIWTR
ncbi:MAG TPA: NUDIX hydrolase [Xanthobacteraceae bacterium]|nr:NUDIX hydrolase [Xanthobacteraceae bacterium]